MLQPGTIPTFNKNPTHVSKKMENVTLFVKAVRAMGLQDFELFSTADLTEEKSVKNVISCLFALGRLMQSSKFAHLPFPTLGKKAAEKNVRPRGGGRGRGDEAHAHCGAHARERARARPRRGGGG